MIFRPAPVICMLILLSVQCSTHTRKPLTTDHYLVSEFKKVFFIFCFSEGFGDSPTIDSLLSEDVSAMGDFPLGYAGYRLIDSLVSEARKEIAADSVRLRERRDYEIGKKRVFLYCLNEFDSERLDSIARDFVARHFDSKD